MEKKNEFSRLFKLGSKKYFTRSKSKQLKRGSTTVRGPKAQAPDEYIHSLVYLRLQKGITQKELAARLKTQQPYISYFENGHDNPTMSFLIKYAKAIGVKLSINITK